MSRPTDEQLARLTKSGAPTIRELAFECQEARERGLMPTVDLASQLTANRIPENMADGAYIPLEGPEIGVHAWTPEQDGKGKTTQVHLVFSPGAKSCYMLGEAIAKGSVPSFVHRMKSGPAVDQLIRLLAEYRAEVWPSYRGVRVGR